ncbi:MAG: AcrB/AcrD/AcrF family protein, partial [Desulfobacca sp.]|nr:AcrB/AcrD/AcrF family protein [Desulfobacca sp.]
MSHGRSDQNYIQKTKNVARFFTESRQIAWVLLFATLLWGLYSYDRMAQRKDPDIPVRQAMAIIPWPGASAEKIEQLMTRRVEEKMAENASVEKIESTSQTGFSLVYVTLTEKISETGKEFDDIKLKLDSLQDLPQGAGPIQFIKDFGDTTALMLTVASPKVEATQLAIRSQEIKRVIEHARLKAGNDRERVSLVVCFPQTLQPGPIIRKMDLLIRYARMTGWLKDIQTFQGSGFIGLDAVIKGTDQQILELMDRFIRERLRLSEFHPDVWNPLVIRHPSETEKKLLTVAGEKYSYAELDRFTSLIRRTLQTIPQVSKVSLVGLIKERFYLDYSQQRLAAYGIKVSNLDDILGARNITLPGGVLEAGSRNLTIDPSGEFKGEKEIGQVVVATSETGLPVYLRDLVEISRDYETFPSLLNFYTWKDPQGQWQRTRAITMAIQMRPGEKIDQFGKAIDQALAGLGLQ